MAETNREIVEKVNAAFSENKPEVFLDHCSDNVEWTIVGDQTLTAVITADAIAELKLRRGDDAVAIIKSTEVMIARSSA